MSQDEAPQTPETDAQPEQEQPEQARKDTLPKRRARRRRNPFVALMSGLLSLLFLGVLATGVVLYIGKSWFESPGPLTETRNVVIPSGQGVRGIAQQLKRAGVIDQGGVIDDSLVFLAGVTLLKAQDGLQAGEYAFEAGVSMREVVDILSSGKAILHALTVPEGLTSKQIIDLVNAHEMLAGSVESIPSEGSLLPETYKFTRGMQRSQLVNRMRADLNKALEDAWQNRDRDLPLSSPTELLTLASIVEKETGVAAERPLVASVFVNRLNKGMKLQSDPTILYGLYGGDAWSQPRTITRSELNAPNPYSTYQIDRLPPGPIANVGVAALKAVSQPDESDYIFFVADGTGGHAFAKTLAEHNENVAAWRKIEKSRDQDSSSAAQTQ